MENLTLKVKHPAYLMFSSDFSQQEPKLTAAVSRDQNMIDAFQHDKDIYATIASLAFRVPYEACLEFHPETGEYQPDGKAKRNQAKTIVLGICYGRSVPSIGQQLYGDRDDMTDEDKTKEAQYVYDAVMRAFPALENLMVQAQNFAKTHGYTETILGRRRHLPDMTLDEFEFIPLPGYVNPDIDPLDLSTLENESGIPKRRIAELQKEFSKYKYFGQIAKRTRELYEKEHIRVVNNRPKINDAKRQCVNCVSLDTEILTTLGWKHYDEISEGQKILAYDLETNEIVFDQINEIHVSEKLTDVYYLKNSTFEAKCTEDHRWAMRNFDTDEVKIFKTSHILDVHKPRYNILRIAGNKLNSQNTNDSGYEYGIESLCKQIDSGSLDDTGIQNLLNNITFEFASKCYNWFVENRSKNGKVLFESEKAADTFQIICICAGKCSNKFKREKVYKRQDNKVIVNYSVSTPKRELYQTARIESMTKTREEVEGVWCVSTNTSTWIARYNGKYYITGNSIIQGSAADFTKMALLKVVNDPKWDECCGEVLTLVHDEIVAQAPVEAFEEAAKCLKDNMEGSGSFLPFDIKCDVTINYRWYGLDAPCPYPKPKKLNTEDSEELKWIQYMLTEMEYHLPVYMNEDGTKPRGDASHGINGVQSDDLGNCIRAYCKKYNVLLDDFIEDIEQRVTAGSGIEKKGK